MRRVFGISGAIALIAVTATGGILATRSGQGGPITRVMDFCETLPAQADADARMNDLGWVELETDADREKWLWYEGLQYMAGRRATMDDWQAAPELENMRLQIEDYRSRRLNADFIRHYKQADGPGLAMIEWVDRMPNTIACDVFLADAADMNDFQEKIFAYPSDRQDRGFVSYSFTRGQQPRPGFWLASLKTISPDMIAPYVGQAPELTIFATAAWRGEMSN